jgi:tetratricopeptide (TPR) repeat protein
MELPPFNDWDMYRIFSAHRNAQGFKSLLSGYPIDFILVELRNSAMPAFIRDSGSFAPIFFDDSAALYAHRERQAELVAKHELKTLNPMNLLDDMNVAGEKRPLDERLLELEIAREVNPTSTRTLHALTYLLVDAKRYDEAESWADTFIEDQPRDPNSHYLKGVVLENTDRCPEATTHFARTFPLSTRDFHPKLHKHLGACAYLTKDFTAAYEHFQRGVNIYLHSEPSETLYQYAFSAVVVGDAPRARILLEAILYQTPDKEKHLIDRARGLLAAISLESSLDAPIPRNAPRQSDPASPQSAAGRQ